MVPVAGAGINAYVAYQVVGQFGEGELTYEQAMAAIFVEGWIFALLSITGVRGGIVKYMPKSIAMASSGGCGAARRGAAWCGGEGGWGLKWDRTGNA